MIENGGNASRAMMEAGYSEAMAHNPHKLTKAPGFKELLAEYGLTESLVTRALVEDIEGKPKKRDKELALAADILGMKKGGGTTNNILIIRPSEEEIRNVERALEDMFLSNGGNQENA